MDTETKEKLTELQHQQEILRTGMEANMKTMKAESETSYERLQSSIAGQSKDIVKFIAGMAAVIVGVLGGLITVLQFST
ncbi:MAG: hypothetical protein OXF09_00390 [Hyphomicrobiales bacterium]|nr:hypothetical protein [Hyphomicrobiales bacterium]